MKNIIRIIVRNSKRLRLQPIRVYCLHHVSAEFVKVCMNQWDWMMIGEFKAKVQAMRQDGVKFISLSDAYRHICEDKVRCRKYVVLTFDDGYASLKEILPWMETQKIPVTLFINGKYLDGKSYRRNPKEKYLTQEELWALTSPLIEIGSHGWEHSDAEKITIDEFKQSIEKNAELLQTHPRYVSLHAYTWGNHTKETDIYLRSKDITPVYMDGVKNYNDSTVVHRELMDSL